MNKFEILLSLLAKVQEDYMGTEIVDINAHNYTKDYANFKIRFENGSTVEVEVTVTEPPKEEQSDGEN